MLEHLGMTSEAARVRAALNTVLTSGVRTGDLGGTATTSEFTDALVRAVESA